MDALLILTDGGMGVKKKKLKKSKTKGRLNLIGFFPGPFHTTHLHYGFRVLAKNIW